MFNLMPEDDADQLAEVSFLEKFDCQLLNNAFLPCQRLVLIKDTVHGGATVSSRRYARPGSEWFTRVSITSAWRLDSRHYGPAALIHTFSE